MIAADLQSAVERLSDMLAAADIVVPFTGAGISTDSGIPDFRSPGGLWSQNRPIDFSDFLASQDARDESWRRRFAIDATFRAARPSRGHQALAALWRAGKAPAIITQNIDNLHQASGIDPVDVVELHGNTTFATCLACGQRHEIEEARAQYEASGRAPVCVACGGFVKTATVSFGQAMPDAAMRRAEALAKDCDLFLVVGSSLVVWPAAGLPLAAKRAGAALVILNREPTPHDEAADLVIRAGIGDVLAGFA
jgi:NAD-dependent deacetylase